MISQVREDEGWLMFMCVCNLERCLKKRVPCKALGKRGEDARP